MLHCTYLTNVTVMLLSTVCINYLLQSTGRTYIIAHCQNESPHNSCWVCTASVQGELLMVLLPPLAPSRPRSGMNTCGADALASGNILSTAGMSPRAWKASESYALPPSAPALRPVAGISGSSAGESCNANKVEASEPYDESVFHNVESSDSDDDAKQANFDLQSHVRESASPRIADEHALRAGQLSASRACQVRIHVLAGEDAIALHLCRFSVGAQFRCLAQPLIQSGPVPLRHAHSCPAAIASSRPTPSLLNASEACRSQMLLHGDLTASNFASCVAQMPRELLRDWLQLFARYIWNPLC